MGKQDLQKELWNQVTELKEELDRLRDLAQQKKEEEDELNPGREITAQEMVEALERNLEESKSEVDRLYEVTDEAWQTRGNEIRNDVKERFTALKDRFESVAQSLREQ